MDSPAPLRTVDEHARRAVALVVPLPTVDLPLDDAVGAVLAGDLVALLDLPPFDAAAMDGYALRRSDAAAPVTLRVVGEVAAGSAFDGAVGPGETVRIMTGAPLPAGADVVVPVERTSTGTFAPDGGARPDAADVAVPALAPGDRAHVRRRGEDVTAGTVVAPSGTVVSARLAALAAALGHATLPVHRPPVVAVLSTGDELTPAGSPLAPGRIPDSNSVLLAGAVRGAGARAIRTGGVPDTPAALAAALDDAVRAGADLLVTTGGVSVGAHDVVRALLASPPSDPTAGATEVDVAAVGMQPGKPQALARWRGVPWVAAPGNPTGAYASFELFVRPMLARLRGLPGSTSGDAVDESRIVAAGWRSPRDRQQLVPVRVDDAGRVAPVGDGHRLSALALADGLAVVPAGTHEVRPGDAVRVRRFAPAPANPPVGEPTAEAGVRFDAVVLAGGRAERLGAPKPGVTLAGRTLLDHALAATAPARRTVVVGPPELSRPGITVVREEPPFGGPVAGLAAGLAALPRPEPGDSEVPVLVLACDVPRAHEAVPLLLAAAYGPAADAPDGAYLVRDGRPQWLVGVYARDALDRSLRDLAASGDGLAGASVRALVAGLRCAEVADPGALSDDVDTWDDAARLAAALSLASAAPGAADDPDPHHPDDWRTR
ncbi:gephyrin-like molybdotransferase Glp [Luteimicrobium sp. NPDC057192]|uniref:molybdopterin-binding protein n=1 Tax=Luteimicrobium sp. NPDC057192 TaxID=3346042 RepID=UPI0036359C6F